MFSPQSCIGLSVTAQHEPCIFGDLQLRGQGWGVGFAPQGAIGSKAEINNNNDDKKDSAAFHFP